MSENKSYDLIISLTYYDLEKEAYRDGWQKWVKGKDKDHNLILTNEIEDAMLFSESDNCVLERFYDLIDKEYPECEVFPTPIRD